MEEFFRGFARGAKCSIHVRLLDGSNSHHAIESIFKAFAKAKFFTHLITILLLPF